MEVRIAAISAVDSGKSTTIATLSFDTLDNGNGLARQKVLHYPHEKETGRTSSVTKTHWQLANSNRFVSFIDLAGHEKYLKTTLHGLTGYDIDYAMVLVGANMGVTRMVKEHVSVVTSMKIPIYVVITKLDLAPDNILQETLENITKLVQKTKRYQMTQLIENIDQVNQMINFNEKNIFDICPVFCVSNKTGANLDILKHYVSNLKSRTTYTDTIATNRKIFRVHEKYNVKGIGIVVSGQVIEGTFNKGEQLYLGPFQGEWVALTIRGLHDNFKADVTELVQNQTGCLALQFTDRKLKINKSKIRKGIVITDQKYDLTREFWAKIGIMTSHSTSVRVNYQPVLNMKTIVQSAIITEIKDNVEILRGGQVSEVKFRFVMRAEFVNVGDMFIFREGNTRGIGKVLELIEDKPDKKAPNIISSRDRREMREKNVISDSIESMKKTEKYFEKLALVANNGKQSIDGKQSNEIVNSNVSDSSEIVSSKVPNNTNA